MDRKYGYTIIASLVAGYLLFLGHLFTVSAYSATDWNQGETAIEITVTSHSAGGFCSIQVTVSQSGKNQTQVDRVYVPPFRRTTAAFSFQTPTMGPVQYDVIWRSWQSSGEVTGS